ncbi:MAG: FAD-binding protein [Oscillospiraceae bacterium]|jgi:L-aspartate oxidase|nr:FAD-binding protein [Oscillospiraceae bacterium]
MNFKTYDIIIVGSGVAGLYVALSLEPRFRVLMLSKRELLTCNSAMAQGGVAAVMDEDTDSFEQHIQDTLIAGGYRNNLPNLRVLVEQGPRDIESLQELGVSFDKKEDGSLSLALEGGHSRNRVAHYRDSTGQEIVTALIKHVRALPNITLLENAHLLNLMKEGDDFLADVHRDGAHEYYTAKTCILATGGIGRVYDFTTNSPTATGDGIYFAYNMGAKIKDLSYIQFHPTAFADRASRECFLISETVRGEGAKLLNCKKERFMQKYEPERMELAPRDAVSNCILAEQKVTGSDEFYLDISHADGGYIKSRFPMIYSRVLSSGFDMTKEPVPIYPCQHYLMGGIEVNDYGQTCVKGLYAAGECSFTGVHGSNRLASNSLLEALVFSRRIAENINASTKSSANPVEIIYEDFPKPEEKKLKPEEVGFEAVFAGEIRTIMQKAYFVTPDYEAVKSGLERINEIICVLETGRFELTPEFVETKALAVIALLILKELKV